MANCTVIKTSETVTSEASEKVAELKQLIDGIYFPYGAQVGDVALYDNVNDEVVFASADADFATDYPASQFTPIGVVAIPAAHEHYGDNKCGVVSLKYMNYSTPDEGDTSSQSMYWGYNSLLLGKAMDSCVVTGTTAESTVEATGAASTPYLPSDNFSSGACATDPNAHYASSSTNSAAPSPFLESGGKNSVYSQTESPSSEANCLSDFDGVGNTQLMLNAVTVEDWKTAETIANSYSEGNYPSACVCWRFHTAGTNQGDWYLPAMGELGYVMVRLKTINASISNLITAYGSEIGSEISTSAYLWSSTEYSSSRARSVDTSNGNVGSSLKYNSNVVRAFARL